MLIYCSRSILRSIFRNLQNLQLFLVLLVLITSNPSKISHAAVLPCDSISDHVAVYVTVNVRVSKFSPRYKYIRNKKSFKETEHIEDFMTFPLSLVYAMESPDEKLDV